MRPYIPLICLMALSAPALADEVSGTVLAYDRVANILILSDKSVFPLSDSTEIAEGLEAGDAVTIIFEGGGENGIESVTTVSRS